MKMPEKHDLLAAILAAKEQGIGAILRLPSGDTFAADISGGAFTTMSDAAVAAIIA